MDLLRQFPRRGDDQAADPTPRARKQTLEDRQDKCRRFAGTGLGKTHNVFSREDRRNCLGLNGGRGFVAECRDACRYFGMKLKRTKTQEHLPYDEELVAEAGYDLGDDVV